VDHSDVTPANAYNKPPSCVTSERRDKTAVSVGRHRTSRVASLRDGCNCKCDASSVVSRYFLPLTARVRQSGPEGVTHAPTPQRSMGKPSFQSRSVIMDAIGWIASRFPKSPASPRAGITQGAADKKLHLMLPGLEKHQDTCPREKY